MPKIPRLFQGELASQINLQLWDRYKLKKDWGRLDILSPYLNDPREYQEDPIAKVVDAYQYNFNKALIVLATGLGKTFVAAESTRKILNLINKPSK